jgi:hypothetical protein
MKITWGINFQKLVLFFNRINVNLISINFNILFFFILLRIKVGKVLDKFNNHFQ